MNDTSALEKCLTYPRCLRSAACLAGCNLEHISYMSRFSDHEEQVLQRAVEFDVALIEGCVGGLKSLG